MTELLKHKMWLKQFLKGFAERVPEKAWIEIANAVFVNLRPFAQVRVNEVENLNEAYTLGHDVAAFIFGGGDEPS